MNWRAFPVLAALLMVAGCGSTSPAGTASPAQSASSASQSAGGLPDDAVITYAFHDASVPPPYHRSITLTVRMDQARIVIDSYGDVLADETALTPPATWQTLGSTVGTVDRLEIVETDEGCAGGTSVDLTIAAAGEAIVSLAPQFCAGTNEAAGVAISQWIAPARAIFPATDVLAPEQT